MNAYTIRFKNGEIIHGQAKRLLRPKRPLDQLPEALVLIAGLALYAIAWCV